jgi:malate dehydrogenase
MVRNKISVIGAGNVGATVAHKVAEMEIGDVVMVDIIDGLPQGKGLDLLESSPIEGSSLSLQGLPESQG